MSPVTQLLRQTKLRRERVADWLLMSFGPRLSIGFKIAAPVLASTTAVAMILGSLVINGVRTQVENAYNRQADAIAIGVEALFATSPDDRQGLDSYLVKVANSQPDLISVRIHSLGAGAPVIASNNSAELGLTGLVDPDEIYAMRDGLPRQDREDTQAGPTLQTVRPLRVGSILFGAVVINSSTAAEDAVAYSTSLAIGAAALVAIVLESIFVLAVLYLGILRRTRRLQKAVKAVEAGDMSIRLEEGGEPPARDEIFNLARQVDHMIGKLDERQRADVMIRRFGQRALEGVAPLQLMSEGLAATRQTFALERCFFASVDADGAVVYAVDDRRVEVPRLGLPVWVGALIGVAVKARRPLVTDRLGQASRLLEPGMSAEAQAAIVPLPRTSGPGEALIAIAQPGTALPDGALATLESVAATIAEAIQRRQADEARQESAGKSKIMAAVSHEMRNPLNAILGFTTLVLGNVREPVTEKQRRQLGFVQKSANNMLSIVNNYLDLARTRVGSLPLQLETVRMAPLIDELVAMMQPAAAAKDVTILVSVAEGTTARADLTRLHQALLNLISNAVKFTPAGGRVFVRARSDGDSTRVVVSDTGVGIASDQQNLVFTEFAKIDAGAMARSKGTGLGLALTKGFVEAMGGTIRLISRPGRGTTFVVRLRGASARVQEAIA